MRVTVKLAALGGDLGSQQVPSSLAENRGVVQFGLFDTSDSTTIGDGNIVFSPSDFRATGGTPNNGLCKDIGFPTPPHATGAVFATRHKVAA